MQEQMVTFKLGEEEFGLDIMMVQEIIKLPPITFVPKSPVYVEGVMNLRGNVLPVINLKRKFGIADSAVSGEARIIVLKIEVKTVGIVVDRVTEVLRLREEQIEPPPPVTVGIDSGYIRGVGKVNERLVIILQAEKIMEKQYIERKAG